MKFHLIVWLSFAMGFASATPAAQTNLFVPGEVLCFEYISSVPLARAQTRLSNYLSNYFVFQAGTPAPFVITSSAAVVGTNSYRLTLTTSHKPDALLCITLTEVHTHDTALTFSIVPLAGRKGVDADIMSFFMKVLGPLSGC